MANLEIFALFFFLLQISTAAAAICGGSRCTSGGPRVRFPFRLTCGYPGIFDLSCNNKKQTILTLPSSQNFTVLSINYRTQIISINDPDNCLPKRFLNNDVSLIDSPFLHMNDPEEYTFLRCGSEPPFIPGMWDSPIIITCLSNGSHTVVVVPASWLEPPLPVPWVALCVVISTVLVPRLFQWEHLDLGSQLTWSEPDCRFCESRGGLCGLDVNATTISQVRCSITSKSVFSNLPRAAKFGILLGMGIPGVLFIVGLVLFTSDRMRTRGRLQQPTTELSDVTNRGPPVTITGLDGPTIESYPKIQLGESWELPEPNDNTCSICLCEYKPKETLRTIPECKHYFHASCVDEWLRMKATCPLCRNQQE